MIYIRQIMDLLQCDEHTANRVFAQMNIDFSECTDREFEREVHIAYTLYRMENSNA